MDTQEVIRKQVTDNPVVLYMKGTPDAPMCGFSAAAVQILEACGADNVATVNVLADNDIRQGIKDFSQWPTVPQLYVNGEFVGGAVS
jgi:monothiol glutaredoxin